MHSISLTNVKTQLYFRKRIPARNQISFYAEPAFIRSRMSTHYQAAANGRFVFPLPIQRAISDSFLSLQ